MGFGAFVDKQFRSLGVQWFSGLGFKIKKVVGTVFITMIIVIIINIVILLLLL